MNKVNIITAVMYYIFINKTIPSRFIYISFMVAKI